MLSRLTSFTLFEIDDLELAEFEEALQEAVELHNRINGAPE